MTKWRECNNPMPEYGGHDCDGDTVETADCNIKHCEGKELYGVTVKGPC